MWKEAVVVRQKTSYESSRGRGSNKITKFAVAKISLSWYSKIRDSRNWIHFSAETVKCCIVMLAHACRTTQEHVWWSSYPHVTVLWTDIEYTSLHRYVSGLTSYKRIVQFGVSKVVQISILLPRVQLSWLSACFAQPNVGPFLTFSSRATYPTYLRNLFCINQSYLSKWKMDRPYISL
jgi:hypothetical protein